MCLRSTTVKLNDIFPKESIVSRVGLDDVIFHELGMGNIDAIAKMKNHCMFELGGTIWDKHIQVTPDENPMVLGPHFQAANPYLFKEASKIIGEDTIKDISYTYTEIKNSDVKHSKFSELLIAVLHQDILHISDIEFSHPMQEIPEKNRKYTFQSHKGLGLFKELISNCVAFCQQENLHRICLTAADIDLVPFFEKHGFLVDDTPTGHGGMERGGSIPMTKAL
jgi:predicted GNAT family N-acyltransferase